MTAISTLTENFTGGAVAVGTTPADTVDTTNSQFDTAPALSGGTAIFIVDPFDSTLRMMETNTVATTLTRTMNFAPSAMMWFVMDVAFPVTFDVNEAILAGYLDAASTPTLGKFFDVRITTTNTLQLRDGVTARYSTTVLDPNVKHRVYVQCQCSATTGTANRWLRMMVYSGGDNLTLSFDSGKQVLTSADVTISNLRMGQLGSATGKTRFGRFRGDDAVQPISTTGTVTLAASSLTPAPNSTVTLTASTTGTGTLQFQQPAGPLQTLVGTGNARTFTAPAGQTLTFTASYGGVTSSPVTIVVPSGISVDAGADQVVNAGDTVTITAATTGSGSLVWSASPTLTLAGSGASRTFRAPASKAAVNYTLTAAYGGATDTMVVSVRPHTTWYKTSGNIHKAYYPARKI